MISLPEGLFYAECEGKDEYVTTRDCRFNAALNEVKEYVREFVFIDGDALTSILENHRIDINTLTPREWRKIDLVIK